MTEKFRQEAGVGGNPSSCSYLIAESPGLPCSLSQLTGRWAALAVGQAPSGRSHVERHEQGWVEPKVPGNTDQLGRGEADWPDAPAACSPASPDVGS